MTDEPDTEDFEIQVDPLMSEHVECDSAVIIFPSGADYFAAETGALLIRVTRKTAEVEIALAEGGWRKFGQKSAAVTTIK